MRVSNTVIYCVYVILLSGSPCYSFMSCKQPQSRIADTSKFGKLVLANVLLSDGEFNVQQPYPNDPYKSVCYWPEGYGQLTNEGKMQLYELGMWLRKRYRNILPINYSEEHVYVRSADVERTIMSVQAHLAALFALNGRKPFNKGLDWDPIPVHTVPEILDEVLASKRQCPRYEEEFERVLNSKDVHDIEDGNAKMFEYLSNNTGINILNMQDVVKLYDTLRVEKSKNFTLPEWANDLLQHRLAQLALYNLQIPTYTRILKRLKSGPLIKEIIDHMVEKINGSLHPNRTLFIFSAHDETISAILNSLGVFNCISPPPAAAVLVELWSSQTETHLVTVSYKNITNGEPYLLKLPGCSELCPLGEFVDLLSYITPRSWLKECRTNFEVENSEVGTWKIVAVVLALLLLLMILIILRMFFAGRNGEPVVYQQIETNSSK